ncbi:hypothetical protein DPMN_019803 [Dreissena polymorpha]|uniref:Uncharacterized protein n=1 Tax=Dreissena polymorpha TaxID=45954 RepID=A0A9D4NFN4_DREPO|nr:hypothetical protein DPMN_019803 [Dreissena polymorpha]
MLPAVISQQEAVRVNPGIRVNLSSYISAGSIISRQEALYLGRKQLELISAVISRQEAVRVNPRSYISAGTVISRQEALYLGRKQLELIPAVISQQEALYLGRKHDTSTQQGLFEGVEQLTNQE